MGLSGNGQSAVRCGFAHEASWKRSHTRWLHLCLLLCCHGCQGGAALSTTETMDFKDGKIPSGPLRKFTKPYCREASWQYKPQKPDHFRPAFLDHGFSYRGWVSEGTAEGLRVQRWPEFMFSRALSTSFSPSLPSALAFCSCAGLKLHLPVLGSQVCSTTPALFSTED